MKHPKYVDRLPCQRNNVKLDFIAPLLLGRFKGPYSAIKVDILPLRLSQLTGTNEYQWSKEQGGTKDKCRVVSVHCPQDSGDAFRIGCCSKVTLYDRCKCAPQIARYIALTKSSCNTIAKDLAATTQCAVRRICGPTFFNPPNYLQQFLRRDLSDRTSANPGKNVVFKTRIGTLSVTFRHRIDELGQPFPATTLKLFAPLSVCADFIALRFSLGSTPSARLLRHVSLLSSAAFNVI
jgi:hypothetical protein